MFFFDAHNIHSAAERNMKTFLGLLMVFSVSGDNERLIEGILGDSVILPCICLSRNLEKEFKWQMEQTQDTAIILKNDSSRPEFHGKYRDRAMVFAAGNSSDCSLLLTNITADDQGKHRCSFFFNEEYKRSFINLAVSAKYHVCQKSTRNPHEEAFQCEVTGRHREAEIQWRLDGELLTNSTTVHIIHTNPVLVPSGLYLFKSKLMTGLTWTSEPECDVIPKGIPHSIDRDCTIFEKITKKETYRPMTYFKFIPVVLVLGFGLVLWHRWKFSQNWQRNITARTQDELQCENFLLSGG